MFLKLAISEIGHDRMALADLAALGEDVSEVPLTNPLPTTIALTAFPFYQVQYANPIGYLGYLYFLEHMPTAAGRSYAEGLLRAGVPESALSFLHEHTTVDVAHNKLMDEYIQRLVRTEADLDAVCYAIEVTGELYALMLQGAIEDAERPRRRAVRHEERTRIVSRRSGIGASVAA
jgi:pyrroloquinoline quinone (PQQ) biosynthesis protein C